MLPTVRPPPPVLHEEAVPLPFVPATVAVPLSPLEPSHALGADTAQVLRERLGMSEAQIARIIMAGR